MAEPALLLLLQFLDGRPAVPKLELSKLQSENGEGDEGEADSAAPPDGPKAVAATAAEADEPARPARVPLLALGKMRAAQAAADGSSSAPQSFRIAAARPGDAAAAATVAATSAMAVDPLDDLEATLGSALWQKQQQQQSATFAGGGGVTGGLGRLLSGRRGSGPAHWERQLSSRGMGTPRSWAQDSGRQHAETGRIVFATCPWY